MQTDYRQGKTVTVMAGLTIVPYYFDTMADGKLELAYIDIVDIETGNVIHLHSDDIYKLAFRMGHIQQYL